MLIALTSFKHAPGVTTTAAGLARSWPRPLLIADLDPAGGDLAAAFTSGSTAGRLLDELIALRRVNNATTALQLWDRATELSADGRLRLLAGLDDPGAAATLPEAWVALADLLATPHNDQPRGFDVIVDCGRLSESSPAWPVLQRADVVVPVVTSTVAGVRQAVHGIPRLARRLTAEGSRSELRLLVRQSGPYAPHDIADALDVPLLGGLPDDPAAAALLPAGSGRRLVRTRLWRTVAAIAADLANIDADAGTDPDADRDPASDAVTGTGSGASSDSAALGDEGWPELDLAAGQPSSEKAGVR